MPMVTQRRLAAILSADVVGYSRLMRRDEQATLASLKESRQIIARLAAEQDGRIDDTAGDSVLAEFPSVVRAVECALAIQEALRERNDPLPEDQQMWFRIGVNLGDVIVDEETIYGDGVNVAARTQALAEPGGISICGPAYEQVKDKLDLNVELLGRQQFKNISEPVVCYRVVSASDIASPDSKAPRRVLLAGVALLAIAAVVVGSVLWQRGADEPSLPVQEEPAARPSVVVLPFSNLSADPQQEYFSDGITNDIITDLSRLQSLRVIARASAFAYKDQPVNVADIGRDLGVRYVVEGSVQKARGRLRINVHVTDTQTGFDLWGERYDGSVDDLFAVQDEVTRRIVDTLAVQLSPEEQRNLGRAATRSFEAYDLFLRGLTQFRARTKERNTRAIQDYMRAIELDPEFARAYGALAVALTQAYFRGWTDSPAETLERALALARKAVELDDQSPQTYWALGYAHLYRKEYADATRAVERAVALAPNYADGYGLLAHINNFTGDHEQALTLIQNAMDLNPYYTFDYPWNLGRAYYGLGRYGEAAQALEEALEKNATAAAPRLFLASSYMRLGRQEDAKWEVEQSLMSDPGFTVSQIASTLPLVDQAQLDRLLDDLRQAGLPE
jgi:adenylate cyclase